MHSVFAQDVRYVGVDEWDDFRRCWILEFAGTCPECAKSIRTYSTSSRSECGCEGVGWSPRISVTTDDLPTSNWNRVQIRARALQVVAKAAATRNGKAAREILAKLVEDFGRKAVDEAVAAGSTDEDSAGNGLSQELPPIRVQASYWETSFDSNQERAAFSYTCPQCHDHFIIRTDTPTAQCRCEGVTWRMKIAIVTSDFAPHAWHPDTIGAAVLEELHSRFYVPFGSYGSCCKASYALWKKLEKDFESAAVYSSLDEV